MMRRDGKGAFLHWAEWLLNVVQVKKGSTFEADAATPLTQFPTSFLLDTCDDYCVITQP